VRVTSNTVSAQRTYSIRSSSSQTVERCDGGSSAYAADQRGPQTALS
jgi:hypothetical protein